MTIAEAIFGKKNLKQINSSLNAQKGIKKAFKPKSNANVPLEEFEQQEFVKWLDLKGLDYFAIPNENNMSYENRNVAMILANKAKLIGVKSGVQDIVVLIPNKILFIEMKRTKKSLSKVSNNQRKWQSIINKYDYAVPFIAYGCMEAIQFVEKNISNN